MKTLSLDLRERIVGAYDAQEGTRVDIAMRFRVSLGMVKKLLQQRRKTCELGHRHRYSGRKAKILPEYRDKLTTLVATQPDLTLAQIRQKLAMNCSVPTLHHALVALGLSYKKDAPRRRTSPDRCRRSAAPVAGRPGPTRGQPARLH